MFTLCKIPDWSRLNEYFTPCVRSLRKKSDTFFTNTDTVQQFKVSSSYLFISVRDILLTRPHFSLDTFLVLYAASKLCPAITLLYFYYCDYDFSFIFFIYKRDHELFRSLHEIRQKNCTAYLIFLDSNASAHMLILRTVCSVHRVCIYI